MAGKKRRVVAPGVGRKRKAGKASGSSSACVVLVGPQGEVQTVHASELVADLAGRWMYVLRNRGRWASDADLRAELQDRVQDDLRSLGIGAAALEVLASARVVEVEFRIDGRDEEGAQGLIAMPWEYLLSVATRAAGRTHPIVVTRLLQVSKTPIPKAALKSVLMLESAPGRIAKVYSFDSEEERIRAALGPDIKLGVVSTTSLERYGELIRATRPDVLHVSGVDNHQAPPLLGEDFDTLYERIEGEDPPPTPARDRKKDGPEDGMMVRGRGAGEVPVAYQHLAALIDGLRNAPIVTLNLYYSACRTAPELLRHGARAALGFFDEVDDELAENFLQELFWELRDLKDLNQFPVAFDRAWGRMSDAGHDLHGTGIVLWTASSVFPEVARAIEEEHETKVRPSLTPRNARKPSPKPVKELLRVDVVVPDAVNYSLLHNERRLLEKLTLTKLVDHVLEDVTVEVELNTGVQNYPYRFTEIELAQPQLALADKVVIPLTADLLRSLREVLQTTVYIRVTCGGRVAFEETHRVKLLPVDQWYDDTANNPWLPSFVLPRDPAITRIISAARRYLITLCDDPGAGFDGYQSVVEGDRKSSEIVDLQVRAIWTAIVNDLRLMYVNPPPAYAARNQRLRTPSEILATTSGTCIDLALLLAACLEYVDIFPVLVLLSGHAFVGYWRSEQSHDAFRVLGQLPAKYPVQLGQLTRSSNVGLVDKHSWRLAQQHFDEIRHYARNNDLAFLEATGLSFGYSFAEASDEGEANLHARADFDSLLDIRLARLADPPVTPLPIVARDQSPNRGEP